MHRFTSFCPSSPLPTTMSLRHISRPDRIQDAPVSHSHSLMPHPSSSHPPHLNGSSGVPTTPGGLSNGSNHHNSIISPAAATTSLVPNGVAAPSSMIHRLAVANEQTWLLIGKCLPQLSITDSIPIPFPINPEIWHRVANDICFFPRSSCRTDGRSGTRVIGI